MNISFGARSSVRQGTSVLLALSLFVTTFAPLVSFPQTAKALGEVYTDFVIFGAGDASNANTTNIGNGSIVTSGLVGGNRSLTGGTNVEFIGVRTGANTGLGNGSVVSGTIVANGSATLGTNTTVVGTLDAASLSAGNGSNLQGAVVVSGSLSVGTNGTLANADASTATLGNGTDILGTLVLPNGVNPTLGVGATVATLENDGDPLPQSPDTFADVVLPPASAYVPSASALDDKTIGVNGALILAPGIYRDLSMGNGADISLSAGTYVFRNVTMGTNSLILVDASGGDVTVFVSGNSSIGNGTAVSISGGSAEDFYLETRGIFTGGANLDWYGTIFATKSDSPGQHSISIGNGLDLVGALYSNQQIEIGTNANIAYAPSDYLDGPEEPPTPTATIIATKVICETEADLPNRSNGADITANTAQEIVDASDGKCSIVQDWDFEYKTSTSNPDPSIKPASGDYTGALGGDWTSFASGSVNVNIDDISLIEVREVLEENYIPFSNDDHGVEGADVSAEFWCGSDVLNYDNWEWIQNPQNDATYYCVALNVADAPMCTEILSDQTLYSSTATQVDGHDAAPLTFVHPGWTASIPGATWIWSEDPVADPTVDTTKVFTHTFNVAGTPTGAVLDIASDNTYTVEINGIEVASSADENNFQIGTQDQYNILAGDLLPGVNTLTITVTNKATPNDANPNNNPAGLLYKLVVNENACIPEAQTSTVTMCKLDNNEQPLSGWTLMLKGAQIDNFDVAVNTPDGTDSDPLTNGVSYIAMAVGTWLNSGQTGNYVDAEYSTQDNWVTQYDGFPGYSDEILELQINEQFGAYWGTYNSAHTYAQSLMGDGGPANFRIYDGHPVPTIEAGWYGDNVESALEVFLYEGYAGITDDEGCVVFEDVPYGPYTADEIMQDGWSHVEGVGEVVVEEPNHTFNIINTQAETFDIVVTKYLCPADTNLSRGANGPDANGNHTPGEGCVLQEGANFGYHLWADQDGTGGPYAYEEDFSGTSQSTDVDGVTIFSNLVKDGRYDIAELDSEGNRIADTDDLGSETDENPVLGLYCTTDPGLAEDNLDFVIASQVEGDTAYCVVYNAPEVQQCDAEFEVVIYSDEDTQVNSEDASIVGPFLHDAWVKVTAPLYWIWSDTATSPEDAADGVTETFTRNFPVVGTPSDAFLDIAADNDYTVYMNDVAVVGAGCADADGLNNNHSATTTCTIPANMLSTGTNELKIVVTNTDHEDLNTPEENPAGLVYQLYFVDNQCEIPEYGTIIVNKETNEGDDTFEFTLYTAVDSDPETWDEIDTDSISTSEGAGSTSFTNLAAGGYALTEVAQDDWINESHTCTSNIPEKDQNNEFISLAAGETVTCTFINIFDEDGEEQPQNTSETIVVDPDNMNGWFFAPENTVGSQSGQMIEGPGTPPLGDGSAQLVLVNSNEGQILGTFDYAGTRLDDITTLTYQTYRTSGDAALAPALSFEFDNDRTDGDNTFKGRMVYEPYHTQTVNTGVWEEWDTQDDAAGTGTGNWWFSNNAMATASSTCGTQGNPCTWSEVLAIFPDGGIRDNGAFTGMLLFKAGSGWVGGFDGNVDEFVIAVQTGLDTHTTTFDFEPTEDEGDGGGDDQQQTSSTQSTGGFIGFGGFQPFGEVLGASTDECTEYLHEYIKFGGQNNAAEVLKLQVFLNDFEANNLTLSGIYDAPTHQAVHAFQKKYLGMVLTPWGATGSTGYVYYTTKKTINEIYCRFTKLFPLNSQQQAEIARVRALGTAWSPDGSGNGLAPFQPSSIQLPPATTTNEPQTGEETSSAGAQGSVAGTSTVTEEPKGFWSKLWSWLTGR